MPIGITNLSLSLSLFIALVQLLLTWMRCCTSSFVNVLSTLKSLSGSSTAAFTFARIGVQSLSPVTGKLSCPHHERCQRFSDTLTITATLQAYLTDDITNNTFSLWIACGHCTPQFTCVLEPVVVKTTAKGNVI